MRFEIVIDDVVYRLPVHFTIAQAKIAAVDAAAAHEIVGWQEPVNNSGIWYGIADTGMPVVSIVAIVD